MTKLDEQLVEKNRIEQEFLQRADIKDRINNARNDVDLNLVQCDMNWEVKKGLKALDL